jgi:hypothetical protein
MFVETVMRAFVWCVFVHTSAAYNFNPLRTAANKPILTDSIKTTPEYTLASAGSIYLLPATQ